MWACLEDTCNEKMVEPIKKSQGNISVSQFKM